MSGQKSYGRIIFTIIVCLLTLSLPIQTHTARADDEVTGTPTATPTTEPSATLEDTPTSSEVDTTAPPTQAETETETPTSGPSNTPSPTLVPTFTPTFTAAPILPGNYVPNEVLVRFKNSATDGMITECLKRINGRIASTIEELSVTVVKLNAVSVSNAVATLSACEGVQFVEPNYLAFIADVIPTDAGWGSEYGLINIRAPQGWMYSTGSSGVTIAIVDTGVDLSHPDLAGKVIAGHDFVNNDSIAQDDNGHGTHVAGIAAAISNNGTGVAGVSWGARIMPVKVLNAGGGGTSSNVALGIIWAADHSAQIINLSVGGPTSSVVLQNAVNYATGRGVLVIAASGNIGMGVFYPAAYPNVIAVGATDSLNSHAGFSNYGPELDLVAPGVSIYSTSPGGSYVYRSGTSMSTAFVSGLAAILMGIPGNSAGTVTSIMENTALDLGLTGWDDFYGNGLIQMDSAIQLALPDYTATPIPSGHTPIVFGPGISLFTPTYTPSLTLTATAAAITDQTPTLSPTVQVELTNENGDTPTPEIIALETAQSPEKDRGGWFVPFCGIWLIILGIALFIYESQRKRRFSSGR